MSRGRVDAPLAHLRRSVSVTLFNAALGSPPEEEAVKEQYQNCPYNRRNESRRLTFGIPAQTRADEMSQHRAGDAEERRDDKTSWIVSWHQQFGDHTDYEPDDDNS